MTKYTFLFCLFLTAKVNGQNCPSGYEERDIKCDGKIVKNCVPINLSCSKCWHVSYSDCQGNIESSIWGGSFDSYEECVKQARDFQKNHSFLGNCPQAGSKYRITLLGSKTNLCINSINSIAIKELKNKIIPFLKRYRSEISNYKRYFSGQPYKPGAIVKEYQSMLKQGQANASKLEKILNNLTDENLDAIEDEFKNIQDEEAQLKQKHLEYVAYMNKPDSQKDDQKSNLLKKEKSIKEQVAEEARQNHQLMNKKSSNDNDLNTITKQKSNLLASEKSIKDRLAEQTKSKKDTSEQAKSRKQLAIFGYCYYSETYTTIGYTFSDPVKVFVSDVINLTELGCNSLDKQFYLCASQWFKKRLASIGINVTINPVFIWTSDQAVNCETGYETACFMNKEQAIQQRNVKLAEWRNRGDNVRIVE